MHEISSDSSISNQDFRDNTTNVHEVVDELQEKDVDDLHKTPVYECMSLLEVIESLHNNEAELKQKKKGEYTVLSVYERQEIHETIMVLIL